MAAHTAIIIGTEAACGMLQRQLSLLPDDQQPAILGWVTLHQHDDPTQILEAGCERVPILGSIADLEQIVATRQPAVALVSLPAAMHQRIASMRTRLRRLGVADRFMPTLVDQLAGVGPRTEIDIDIAGLIDRPARQIDHASVARVIAGKRVLITGAGGSIGSELARISARFDPARLVLIERSENALFEIDRQIAQSHPALERIALLHDVVNEDATLQHMMRERPDIVFHAAAHKHVPMMEQHPYEAIQNNLLGTKSVADAAHLIGAERFVLISTDKAVNPSSIMGATKRMAELYVQHLQTQSATGFSMVRFGNVLGSSGSVLQTWSRQIADGGPLTVTHPDMTRYFMTIPEAAALVIQSAALQQPDARDGQVFLLDMGEPINILHMARRFIEAHGLAPIVIDPANSYEEPAAKPNQRAGELPIMITGPRPGEKLHESLAFDTERMRRTEHRDIHHWAQLPPDQSSIQRMLSAIGPMSWRDEPAYVSSKIRELIPEMVDPVAA